MSNQPLKNIPKAAAPLLPTDKIIVSRDGIFLTQTTLDSMPLSSIQLTKINALIAAALANIVSANAVTSMTNATANEGATLTHTVTLSASTGGIFAFAIVNNTTSNTDYTLPPIFGGGVTLSGANIIVPNGVSSFSVGIAAVTDNLVETNETYTITIGGVPATGTIINVPATMTVASIDSPIAAEGATLTFNIVLSGVTQQAQLFPFTIGGTATAGIDYATPLSFGNGVTISGTNLSVPIGVSSFPATTLTSVDALVEPTETLILTVGGVPGTGSITDVPVSTITPVSRMTAFETPYGMLTSAQQTAAATSGGFITACASRTDTNSDNYAVDISTTGANGTYTRLLDNQVYSPYAEVNNVLSYPHPDVPFVNEFDLPATLTANTIGIMQDANGLQEFGLYSTYNTVTAAGATAKVFTGAISAIFDTPPIAVSVDNSAKIFLLNNRAQGTTLRANGTVVYLKFIAKLGAQEYTGAVTPIAVTIASRASKPLPPRNVQFGQNGDLYSFPSFQFDSTDLTLQIDTASRAEVIPSGFFSPSGLNESGVTYEVDAVGANGVYRTIQIPLGATNSAIYTAFQREVTDGAQGAPSYKFYAVKAGIRSLPFSYDLLQDNRNNYPQVTAATATLSGSNILIAVTLGGTTSVPYLLDYALGGDVFTTQAFGAITCDGGVTLMSNQLLQIPVGVASFTMTVPTVAASGKTLTTSWGAAQQFPTSTTVTATLTAVTFVQVLGTAPTPVPEGNTFNTARFKAFFAAPCVAGSYPFSFRTGAGYATYPIDFIIETVFCDVSANATVSGNNIIVAAGNNTLIFEIRTLVDGITEAAEDIWMTFNGLESNGPSTIAANAT